MKDELKRNLSTSGKTSKLSNKSRQTKSGRGRKLEQTIQTEDDSKPTLLPSTAKCDVCGRTFSNISVRVNHFHFKIFFLRSTFLIKGFQTPY